VLDASVPQFAFNSIHQNRANASATHLRKDNEVVEIPDAFR